MFERTASHTLNPRSELVRARAWSLASRVDKEIEMSVDKRIGSVLASALVVGAIALPSAAQARLNTNPVNATDVVAIEAPASTSQGDGFQWGDAGIGAAGAVLLLGAAVGVTGSSRRRHVRSTVAS
jgi:hypothetical protein